LVWPLPPDKVRRRQIISDEALAKTRGYLPDGYYKLLEKVAKEPPGVYPSWRDDPRPMLTVREVAHSLNIHVNTVRRWSDQGVLKSFRIGPRGDRRFRREDILLDLEEAKWL